MIRGGFVFFLLFYMSAGLLNKCPADPFDDVIDWDGRLEVGAGYRDRGFGRSFIPAESPVGSQLIFNDEIIPILKIQLDYTISITDRIEVSFDMKGDINDLGIQIKKGYVEFDISKLNRLRVGNMKKEFGIEERQGGDDILSINRSLLNSYIQSFGILDHDISLQWRTEWESSSDSHLQIYAQGGADASERVFLNNAAEIKRPWGNIVFGNMLAQYREQLYDIINAGYWKEFDSRNLELEFFTGKDPNLSFTNEEIGAPENAWFAAFRILWARQFTWQERLIKGIEPLFMFSFLVPDLGSKDYFIFQLLPGVNVYFDSDGDIRWMTNAELVFAPNSETGLIGRLSHGFFTQIQVNW